MKKVKKVAVEASPSGSSAAAVALPDVYLGRGGDGGGGGERNKARMRYQSLMQDYEELVKETEAKKKRLLKAKQKKLKILSEVKFLRKRLNSVTENPSKTAIYKLKKQPKASASASPLWHHKEYRPNQGTGHGVLIRGQPSNAKEDFTPRTSAVIDLNEACVPSDEEKMEEFAVGCERVEIDKGKKHAMKDEDGANDVRMPICLGVRNAGARVGKRKITWQDQVALKV